MKHSSDKMYQEFKDYDFADAKPVAATPHLAALQAQSGQKSRITMRVDSDVLAIFKTRAKETGGSYQTMMNDALRQFTQGFTLSDVVREAIERTLRASMARHSTGRGKK